MERIVYRITLDSHKTGIQRTLQGFETADNMARTIAVNITASGDTYEIPLDNVVAMMYVTTPNASEPSINECRIEDNTIYYDVLPIVEEGITEMKIKLIETSVDGAKRVLIAPKFVVEVTESGTEDDSAEQTTTFTALENAIAKAHGVYDQRLLNIEIGPDCVFRAIYADGTVYENHYLHEALYNGNALLSESWAKGGTGMRKDEEINNSKYFSNVSRSSSVEASETADVVRSLVDMAKLYSTYTSFNTNFETGELEYISASHNFDIDEETGELNIEGEVFEPDEIVEKAVEEYLATQTQEFVDHIASEKNPHKVTATQVGALPIGGGTLTGSLTMPNAVNITRIMNDILYKTVVAPSGYSIDSEVTSALAHYIDGVQSALLLLNENGVAFRDLVNNKQYNIFGQHNTVPVKNGGTGGTDRNTAFKNLSFLGHQPITSITDDTMTNWGALGSGYATYSTLGLLNDQPNQYGFLINYTDGGVAVCQFWIVRPTGEIYVRGANGSGWNRSWKKVFDASHTIPVANGGTGATTAEKALQNIVGFKPVQQGGGTSQGTNKIYIGWSTSSDGIRCTVDSTDMGYMLTGPAMASGAVLIGNGGGKVTTRPITNNTGVANASGTNIPTCNTLNYHVREWVNRDVPVDAADTGYNAYRARGIALVTSVPSSITNGCAAFVYQ